MAALQLPQVKYDLIRLTGGMDQITPTLSLKAGVVRRATNFECSLNGGYTRIAGYERFDGRFSPSAARYTLLAVSSTDNVAVGDTLTGLTSGATGKVLAIDGNKLVVGREVNFFATGETIQINDQFIVITELVGIYADGYLDAFSRNLAANDRRQDIQAVPGEGPVLGVQYFKGSVYAWRKAAGSATLGMYQSSTSGWTAVALGQELSFDTGTAAIAENAVITGATSGATATVKRVVIESGDWTTSNAAGRFIFASSTGTFAAGENLLVSGVARAKAGGAQANITLASGGRVETAVGNFGGGQQNQRMYGVDGVNRAFEFDGTVYVPIVTGMNPDKPNKVAVHKQHLFLAFGNSLQFSGIGEPYKFDPVLGAGEIAMNGAITQLMILPGDQSSGALAIYTENDTSVLYGTSSENFTLTQFAVGAGAIPFTGQSLGQAYVLGEFGVTALSTTLNFGNFAASSLTLNIRPFVQTRRFLASGSIVNREKSQYRVFFSDGSGLYLTIANNEYMGAMPVQFPDPVRCTSDGENADGAETSFFGSDNGFVYRLDAGTSFDGDPIPSNLSLVYNSIQSPRILKRFRRASVEVTGNSYAEFSFGYDLGYRSPEILQANEAIANSDLRSSYWDEFTWDDFVWDAKELSPNEIEMTGTGENVAIRISSVSPLFGPFTVNSIILHYTLRRGLR